MQIYSFGSCELSDWETENITKNCPKFKWLAYDYRTGSYQGEGEIYALDFDGNLWYSSFSHCSCHGPEVAEIGLLEKALDWTNKERTVFDSELDGKINDLILDSL